MTKKILFVDDDRNDLKRLSDAFYGMERLRVPGLSHLDVDFAEGVDHAMAIIDLNVSARKLGHKSLDLIITDLDMPGTGSLAIEAGLRDNGNTIAKYACEKLPGIKVIGHTGGDPARFDTGYVSYAVPKIRDPYLLAGLIRSALGGED